MAGYSDVKCTFQLRRIGAPATCKGMKDSYRLQEDKMLIGRHLSVVDIYLNSSVNKKLISRQHAELWIECHRNTQVVYLLDKSTNGTFVNDIKIVGKVRLAEGDTLTFGHTQGIQIQPGMHQKQPESEFRFVLEKVSSENTPPHGASSSIPNGHPSSAYCEHQHTPDLDTKVRTNACTSLEHLTHYNYQEDAFNGQECFQSLPCTDNVKLLPRVCRLSPTICPMDLNRLNCDIKDETAAAISAEPFTKCHQGPAHQKRTVEFSEDAAKKKLLNTETDKELLELTSIISAKAAKFDSSDSDKDLEGLFPVFSSTKQDAITLENPTNVYRYKGGHAAINKKKKKRRRGYPRTNNKSQVHGEDTSAAEDLKAEVCDSYDCCKPTDKTVDWVQCDGCDKWYHVVCVGCDYDTVKKDSAAFHCGCTQRF